MVTTELNGGNSARENKQQKSHHNYMYLTHPVGSIFCILLILYITRLIL